MRINVGTHGGLRSPYSIYYSFSKCFNGKFRTKGVAVKGSGKRYRNNSRKNEEARGRRGELKQEERVCGRSWGSGRHQGPGTPAPPITGSPSPGSLPARPPARPGARRQSASAASTPPRATPTGLLTSLQRERSDTQLSPPHRSRALLLSLPEGRAFNVTSGDRLPGASLSAT